MAHLKILKSRYLGGSDPTRG